MDLQNMKSWVPQPDVCRCCFANNGTCDLLTPYINEVGEKEVYNDILRECFGIKLAFPQDWNTSHFICELCIGHLQDANKLKKQVLQAEENFIIYLNNVKGSQDIKLENDQHYKDDGYMDSEYTAVYDEINIKTDTVKRRHNNETVCASNKHTDNHDLNTPAIRETEVGSQKENLEITEACNQHSNTQAKQISERKKIRLTCDIVLKNTTACPFRHIKSWFQCFYCTQEFMEINLLRQHLGDSHKNIDEEIKKIKRFPRSLQIDISILECCLCNLNLTDIESLCKHFLKYHNKIIYKECIADYKVNRSPYCCHLCNKQFHVFRTLTTHLNVHYANCICDVCGKSFINSKRLKVHKRTHESGNFPCTECGKILTTKSSKANHMQSAHSKHIIRCHICLKPLKHYNDRVKHMSDVHNITHKFKCPICSREYNIKHYLATHMRQTHGNKNKKCHECGMGFITNHGLKKHMQKHSGVKAFSCDVCNKSYARSYTLKEHMRAHESEIN